MFFFSLWLLAQTITPQLVNEYHRLISNSLTSFQNASPIPYKDPMTLAVSVGLLGAAQNPIHHWPDVSGNPGFLLHWPLLWHTQIDLGYVFALHNGGWEGWQVRFLWLAHSWSVTGISIVLSTSFKGVASNIGNVQGIQYGVWVSWEKGRTWIAWGNHILESQTRLTAESVTPTGYTALTRWLQPSLMGGFQTQRWRLGIEWSNLWQAAGMFWFSWKFK